MTTAKTSVSAQSDCHNGEAAESQGSVGATNPGVTAESSTQVFGTGSVLGYARVSTSAQDPTRQIEALSEAGCERIFTDHGVSGRKASRPEFDRMLDMLREGDVLVCVELSRLGRNTRATLALIEDLDARHVSLRILNMGLDTQTPTGRLLVSILAAVSTLEVELLQERVRSGLASAKKQGRIGGRPAALNPEQRVEVIRLHGEGRATAEIARLFGCSPRTIYRITAEMHEEGRSVAVSERTIRRVLPS